MKKILLSFILAASGFVVASADEPMSGIIATYEGSEVCYMLADIPIVKYETIKGVQYATLYLQNMADPVLCVALVNDKKLIIAYCEYTATTIGEATNGNAVITERNGKKVIQGGKLIIIDKDGKKYNATGREI